MGRKSLRVVRRKEIIIGLYETAKEIGLENASIAKVASRLEINPSLILHYFKTRDEMMTALIEFILEKYSDIYKVEGNGIQSTKKLYKLIDNLFSRKWNELFDDGVFYSCYSLIYRDDEIRRTFKILHDSLREWLIDAIKDAKENDIVHVENEVETAEVIFALIEGAYYYLGMVDNKKEYQRKLKYFKKQALKLLNVPEQEEIS